MSKRLTLENDELVLLRNLVTRAYRQWEGIKDPVSGLRLLGELTAARLLTKLEDPTHKSKREEK